MTLQEAIKTGLPFTRSNYNGYIIELEVNNHSDHPIFVWESDNTPKAFGSDDIFSIDWIVKEDNYNLSEIQIKNWLTGSLFGRRYKILDYYGKPIRTNQVIDELLEDFKNQ